MDTHLSEISAEMANRSRTIEIEAEPQADRLEPLVEATGWIFHANGNVELVSYRTSRSPFVSPFCRSR
ncbi:MAG: hypothetical protein J7641_17565 [Cyanobacteria bacterium SID2]|nr:hypothetical protein [Cyanobacteria bacterium SID2]MBP0003717.1 hypothetical protein [Cyanobacteria bacterium SBC]